MRGRLAPARPVTLSLLVLLVLASGSVGAACTPVSGPFANSQVYPPECTSPVLLCTHGDLDGDLDGDYDFTMTSLAPALDPAHPNRFVFTGESTITTTAGIMTAQDTGWLDYNPIGLSDFETIVNIDGGSGAFEGASGQLVATGALDLSTGKGMGEYVGEVCVD